MLLSITSAPKVGGTTTNFSRGGEGWGHVSLFWWFSYPVGLCCTYWIYISFAIANTTARSPKVSPILSHSFPCKHNPINSQGSPTFGLLAEQSIHLTWLQLAIKWICFKGSFDVPSFQFKSTCQFLLCSSRCRGNTGFCWLDWFEDPVDSWIKNSVKIKDPANFVYLVVSVC